ncbi:MAG: AAA family ATPase [Candidatus Shapirobacteria bacterium]|jgi:DNA repair protein RadA/Sms
MPDKVVQAATSSNDVVQILNQIEVPKKFFNRLNLGVQVLDEIFGGQEMPGILPGSSFLFTGMPGAGKSTMCLQLAELFHKNIGRNVLYNIGEENKNMIKLRADRLGIEGEFCIGQHEEVDSLIEFCKKNGVEVLFQDSLQSMRDHGMQGPALLRSVTKKLHMFAKDEDVTVFIVGHINKGGMFAGPQEIKHEVDVHAHLSLNTDTGNRVFELQKNRFGPACIPYEFVLSACGLDFHQVKQEAQTAGHSKSAERRDVILKLVKDKLLEGEKISGYCFERFNVDCSGGFWRGMLAKAVKELQNQGFKIAEERINGRLHSYIEV